MTPVIQNRGKVKTIVTESSSTVAKFWGLGEETDGKREHEGNLGAEPSYILIVVMHSYALVKTDQTVYV